MEDTIQTKSISERELAGFQYLGGYVIHKLFNKERNSPRYKLPLPKSCCEALAILQASRSTKPQGNSTLVDALSRGGLWSICEELEFILVIAEKYFCIKSCGTKRKLIIFNMVKSVMEFSPVVEKYKVIL